MLDPYECDELLQLRIYLKKTYVEENESSFLLIATDLELPFYCYHQGFVNHWCEINTFDGWLDQDILTCKTDEEENSKFSLNDTIFKILVEEYKMFSTHDFEFDFLTEANLRQVKRRMLSVETDTLKKAIFARDPDLKRYLFRQRCDLARRIVSKFPQYRKELESWLL